MLSLAVPIWPHRDRPSARAFYVFLIATSVWSFGYAAELCSPDLATAVLSQNIQFFGIPAAHSAFFALVLILYGTSEINRGIWFVLLLHSVLVWAAAWTDSSMHTLRLEPKLHWAGEFWVLAFVRGPAYIANIVISNSFLAMSVLMLGYLAQSPIARTRKQAQTLLLGLSMPILATVSRILGFEPLLGLDLTPVMFSMSAVAIAYGVFRWSLISVVPIARGQVFDGLTDAVIVLNPDGQVADANPAAAALYGIDLEVLARSSEAELEKIIPIKGLNVQEGYVHVQGKDFQLRRNVLDGGEQTAIGAILQFTDVTHQRHVEAELRQAKELAEVASEAKSRFVANVSHELRTPLTGVAGLTELLAKTKLDPVQAEYLTGISQCSETLLGLISDVLDLSKLDADSMSISRDRLDLVALVREVAGIHRNLAAGKDLRLVCDIQVEPLTYVWGDPLRMRQVLHNLLGNAVKFTSAGLVTVTVVRETPSVFLIRVSDTGIGIPLDRQAAVFEDFEQADASTTRTFGGTGLGLPITRALVQRMGGSLELDSAPGAGTTITVRLPLEETDAPQKETADAAIPAGIRVLLAEDNEVNALVIGEQLAERGCVVARCANGEEALELFGSNEFDLVLLDIQMPVLDGLSVARQICERWPDRTASIFALTANAFVDERQRAAEAGMDGFLTKPIRKDDLDDALRALPIATLHSTSKHL